MSNNHAVVLVISDLIFETKVRATGQVVGVAVRTVRSAAELSTVLDGAAVPLVIVDLNTGTDAIESVRAAASHSENPRVLAFVSHVDADLAQAARDAGAHDVLPRSRFVAELPTILAAATGS